MNDYYIGVDREGRPYIAHAFWNRKKGTSKKDHKYIAKIGEGAKARYFYTKQELDAYYKGLKDKTKDATKKVKDKVKEIAKDPSGAKKREEAIETYNKAMDKAFRAGAREYNKESFIKDIPYMPSNASKTELTKSYNQLDPDWIRTDNPDGSTTYQTRSDKGRKSIQSLIDERKSPTTAQEMNRQMDLIDEYNNVTDQIRKEGSAYEEEFNKLRKAYAKTPLGMIDIASNAVGRVADKTNEKVKAAEEKRDAKRIDKDNWNMEQQVMELRGQGSTFHSSYSRKTGSVLTENEYPYVTDAKKAIVNQANEILTQYKASTDKTERKKLESKLKKLQRDMKELVY